MTSFFVSFDYNETIVCVLKDCENAHYEKKTREWEIPATQLSNTVNKLYMIDDVKITLLDQQEEKKSNICCEVENLKTKPFSYQIDGINYGLNNDKWLLLD